MRILKLLGSAAIVASLSTAAYAADGVAGDRMAGDPPGTPMMMKAGETLVLKPDGTMGKMMMSEGMMTDDMMKMAKPMDHCMVMTMGKDGKMMMMDDMKMSDGTMMCDQMMMKK